MRSSGHYLKDTTIVAFILLNALSFWSRQVCELASRHLGKKGSINRSLRGSSVIDPSEEL